MRVKRAMIAFRIILFFSKQLEFNVSINIQPTYEKLGKKSKSAVPDGKALPFARTQLGHHVSLLIGLDFIS